jgi:hypothetical protein
MKQNIKISIVVWTFSALSFAGLPVQDFSLTSIGVDYTGLWRGETITKLTVPAHENTHHLGLRYAPVKYVAFSLGLGIANYTVDTIHQTQFKGSPSISPSFGFAAYSPIIASFLRFTLNVKGYYLYCENKNKSFLYSGPFTAPGAGVVLSLGEKVDLEAGARGIVILGEMSKSGESTANYFSNNNMARGYLTLVMHSPSEGAYCMLDFDASPSIKMDWSDGPFESSISLTLGFILRADNRFKKTGTEATYPGYEELKKKIDKMEKEMK